MWNTLKNVRPGFEQIQVPLLRRIGQKGSHYFSLLAEEDFHDRTGDGFKSWKILKHDLGGLFIAYDSVGVFDADEIVFGRALGIEVAHRYHPLLFGKEISGLFFAIDEDVLPDAALHDKVSVDGHLSFPEEDGTFLEVLCIHALLNDLCLFCGKGGDLVEVIDESI